MDKKSKNKKPDNKKATPVKSANISIKKDKTVGSKSMEKATDKKSTKQKQQAVPTEVKAKLRFLHMSPKKVRLVTNNIRGLSALVAQQQLKFSTKAASRPILKLLNSAIANAEHNFNLKKENLFIKEIRVDDGPTLRRWKPRAHGRATPIRKRSAHINLVLGAKEKIGKAIKKQNKIEAPTLVKDIKSILSKQSAKSDDENITKETKDEKTDEPFDVRRQGKRREFPQADRKKKKARGTLRKWFSRKAI